MRTSDLWLRNLVALILGGIPGLFIGVQGMAGVVPDVGPPPPVPSPRGGEGETAVTDRIPAIAQLLSNSPVEPTGVEYNPPNLGAPGDTRDAGGRPFCQTPERPLMALSPSQTNWGETIDAHPTFWLYIPEMPGSIALVLTDEQTQAEVFRTQFDDVPQGGMVRLPLPETAPPLEVDRLYRWQLQFVCNESADARFQVNGVIVRRSPPPSFLADLETASPRQRVQLFAAHGLWYNALTELADLRLAEPENDQYQRDWADLLSHPSVALDDLIAEPLLN